MIIAVDNAPANAINDLSSATSYISSRFLAVSLPRHPRDIGGRVLCRVFAVMEDVSLYVDVNLSIMESLSYDVILGRDWRSHVLRELSENRQTSSTFSTNTMEFVDAPAESVNPRVDGLSDRCCITPADNEASSGYHIVSANLFGQRTLGDEASVFRCDVDQLHELMSAHGIAWHGIDISRCRQQLLSHLIMGSCVSHSSSFAACKQISRGFSNCNELLIRLLCDISEPRLASLWPTENLRAIASSLQLSYNNVGRNQRRDITSQIRARVDMLQSCLNVETCSLRDIFQTFERHDRVTLVRLCSQHYISVSPSDTVEEIRCLLCEHLVTGACSIMDGVQCEYLRQQWLATAHTQEWVMFFLSNVTESRIPLRPLQRILKALDIPFRSDDSLARLRSVLKTYFRSLSKGKAPLHPRKDTRSHNPMVQEVRTGSPPPRTSSCKVVDDLIDVTADADHDAARPDWPYKLSSAMKENLIRMFQEETSSAALAANTCASCAEHVLKGNTVELTTNDFDYDLLRRPDHRAKENNENDFIQSEWLHSDVAYHPTLPLGKDEAYKHFADILIDPSGIVRRESEKCLRLRVCKACHKSLKGGRVPPLALANRTFLGDVPEELKNLTVVEEAMIARCRAKCWIVQLKEEFSNLELPNNQRGVKGHIIIYPQNASAVSSLLPPSLDDVSSPICVLFVGPNPPSQEWLREKAKPLAVRPAVVRRALLWLKQHNPLYRDITINEPVLNSMKERDFLPVTVQHVRSSIATETQTSRYDSSEDMGEGSRSDVDWQNVVITNVDGEASANALRAAAFRHVNEKKGGYIQIPHDAVPVNEFIDPKLFPMIYPTLFPYGIGGFRDQDRESPLSMQRHVKHLFNLNDRRFQEHYSFLFTAFNMLQRHSILLYTKLKTQRSNFDKLAVALTHLDVGTIHTVIERMSRGESVTEQWNPKEAKLFALMHEVSAISSNVPGSVSARTVMRNEIRALMVDKGLPNFYITINPADVYNPIVKVLAGSEIDIDHVCDEDVPTYWSQSTLVAKNPAVAASFFNTYMKAFISCLLRYDRHSNTRQEGALGMVKAYYGCVEAQGRGTLHCHMLLWIEGGLNPNELKQKILSDDTFKFRLLLYLDDTISNQVPEPPQNDLRVPSDKFHPCSVRGIKIGSGGVSETEMRLKDMSNLVAQCQKHTHTRTCYKYFKGAPGERRECRFNLDERNVRNESLVDAETGEISLRKLDGMVNNFNSTILEAIRCNMDIQFVGSGTSAKAMIYYMTDYITKTSLKTHVALAALELAVSQTEKYVSEEADASFRAKALLRKCAYVLLSHQELSAPQVASYLMGYEDHFKSHDFVNLYWPSCERLIDSQDPSPECDTYRQMEPSVQEESAQLIHSSIDEDEPASDDDTSGSEPNDIEVPFEVSEDVPDEEVLISVDSDGQLVASTNVADDYRFRGDALQNMSLWEFRARIQKVRMMKAVKNCISPPSAHSLQHIVYRKQIYVPLKNDHPQNETHILRLSSVKERLVPVPTGPKIPQRDSNETLPRFCRLMLIFFKPWSSAQSLRLPGETWLTAYETFLRDTEKDVRAKIDNTQILHECRDSRDSHFAERRKRRTVSFLENDLSRGNTTDDVLAESVSHDEILQHLRQIQLCYDNKMDANQQKMMQCLDYAESSGLYDLSNAVAVSCSETSSNAMARVSDGSMEDIWETEYENRRSQWKKKAAISTVTASAVESSLSMTAEVKDGSSFTRIDISDNADNVVPTMAHIQRNTENGECSHSNTLYHISDKWGLNHEQHRAFRIITEHSLLNASCQLRMFIAGPGGSGKSRVINALREYFDYNGQSRRLQLASFTGIASRNIMGMTLHASLFLNQRSGKHVRTKTLRDLIAVWEGVDYLVVDEVSMVGLLLLYDMSKSLSEAKSNSHPFGGINLIFVGDFAQLPPVCETRLFARVNPYSKGCLLDQKKILGKLLWLSVDTVVVLAQIMRQCESKDNDFVELLGRLRGGRCTLQDFALLNTRLLTKTKAAANDPSLWNTPMLVTQNAVKDFMNEKASTSFSRRSGQELHWYYALDKVNGTNVTDNELKQHLRGLSTSQTNQRLGRLPLVIGMPVMVTQNFDVEHGIVNGSIGTLKSIRYVVDEAGDRYATSCIVHIPDMTGPKLAHLKEGEAAVLRDTVSMTFRHPYSGRNCTIKRQQLPLVPAFCITVHKSQGQTLDRVIVDLEGCRGTEAPYVMLSRVKSLEGLHILRPFQYKRITVHPSQESRIEFQRLEILHLQTLKKYGTDEEQRTADVALKGACLMFQELDNIDLDQPPPQNLLANAQQSILEQTAIIDKDADSAASVTSKRFRHAPLDPPRRVRPRTQ